MATVQVEVFSDVVCPWCFVGRRRLERAAQALAGRHELLVTWKPYQLNPWMPAEGMTRAEYRTAKFGSEERIRSMDAHLAEVGRGEGIELAFERIARTPNTIDAHRLTWLASQRGRQIEVVDALFLAYFTHGRDIGDRAVLAEIGGEAGLDAAEVRRFLDSEAGLAEVEEELEAARGLGIDGVPFFVFAGKYAVSGAQPAEVLADAIEKVVALEAEAGRERALAAVGMGDACSVDAPENC